MVFSQFYLIDFLNGMVLDSVTKLDGRQFPILPPTSFLVKIDIKGERRRYPRLDGLLYLFRKTVLHIETDLPNPICLLQMDIFNRGLLTEGREGKDPDQKEKNPSDYPNVLTLVSHRVYLRFEI